MAQDTISPSGQANNQNGNGSSAKGTEQIVATAKALSKAAELLGSGSSATDGIARMQIATGAQELLRSVQAPPEAVMGLFAQMSVVSAIHIFQDWRVFDTIPANEPVAYSDLASQLDAEESLLIRIAWMLTSSGILKQIGLDHLAHTPISRMLRDEQPMGSMFKLMFTNIVETSAILPSYFSTYGRKEPSAINHVPTTFLAGEPELGVFELLHKNPAQAKNFMRAMAIPTRRTPTLGMYEPNWVVEKAAAEEDKSRPVWVDVGGSKGHTLLLFLEAHPGLPAARCVVQDLPEVIEGARKTAVDEKLQDVQWVSMDFHKESPVEGAYVYYLRHIMRDYPDSVCSNILRNVASAMADDSRLLISELVATNPPANVYSAFKDYAMLAVGGKERTMENWQLVVGAAGLRISGVFRDKGTPHAVIECAKMNV